MWQVPKRQYPPLIQDFSPSSGRSGRSCFIYSRRADAKQLSIVVDTHSRFTEGYRHNQIGLLFNAGNEAINNSGLAEDLFAACVSLTFEHALPSRMTYRPINSGRQGI